MKYVRFMERHGYVFLVVVLLAAVAFDYSKALGYWLAGLDCAAALVSTIVVNIYYRAYLRDLKKGLELWAETAGVNRSITDPMSWPAVNIIQTATHEELIRVILEGDVALTEPIQKLLEQLTECKPTKNWREWGVAHDYHPGTLKLI